MESDPPWRSGQTTNAPDPVSSWLGGFDNAEVNALHAAAFQTRLFDASEWDWEALTGRHSLGWVTARLGSELVGFVNILWDGLVHAWLQDVIVAPHYQRLGVGLDLVSVAPKGAPDAGCEWLHVDFDAEHSAFYIDACGFRPSTAGIMRLNDNG